MDSREKEKMKKCLEFINQQANSPIEKFDSRTVEILQQVIKGLLTSEHIKDFENFLIPACNKLVKILKNNPDYEKQTTWFSLLAEILSKKQQIGFTVEIKKIIHISSIFIAFLYLIIIIQSVIMTFLHSSHFLLNTK